MNDLPEFSEQYSRSERIRFAVVIASVGGAFAVVGKIWFFPWLESLINSTPCRTLLGYNGVFVLWWGLWVGLPFFNAVLVLLLMGSRGYKILRDNQVPYRREKVLRPTRIKRGFAAICVGWLHILAFTPFAAITVWGYFQADAFSNRTLITPVNCPENTLKSSPSMPHKQAIKLSP